MSSIQGINLREFRTPMRGASVRLRPELPVGVLADVPERECKRLKGPSYADGLKPEQRRAQYDREVVKEKMETILSVKEKRDPVDRGRASDSLDPRRAKAAERLLSYGIKNPTKGEVDDELEAMKRESKAQEALTVALEEMASRERVRQMFREAEGAPQFERRMVWLHAHQAPVRGGRRMR
jgi:hypothetical protein